jgi:hypothetical protein
MNWNTIARLGLLAMLVLGFSRCTPSISREITAAFDKKFPAATKVRWGKENAHDFEAEFEMNGAKSSANFSEKGEWLETETEIPLSNTPEPVKTFFYTQLGKSSKIKHVYLIETIGGSRNYEIEYKSGIRTKEFVVDKW